MYLRQIGIFLFVLGASGPLLAQTKTAPPAPAAIAMKPGLWETTLLIETAGSNSHRTVTSRTCFSAEDVTSIARVLPQQHEEAAKCDNRDIKQSPAGELDWRVVCTGKGMAMGGSGKMTATANTFSAHASLESKAGGKSSKVEQTIGGKWLSECK
jgi:Protein of unknown function (DUF3617)